MRLIARRDVYTRVVRTTINLEDDVAAALARLRKERATGLSAVVNELIRAGLSARPRHERFSQRTAPLGLSIDVTNVAETIELLEEHDAP